MTISQTAVVRIREEMRAKNISQRDLAEKFRCSQGKIAKLLNNTVKLRVEDLARLANAVGIPITEAIRDRGLEFYAEVTPLEQRILERIRQRGGGVQSAILQLLDIEQPSVRRKVGRPTMLPPSPQKRA